jgi:hypothetical protein
MERVVNREPFSNELEFLGSMMVGGKKADKLHMIIQYPNAKPGKIKGYVLGNEDAYNRLRPVASTSAINISLSSERRGQDGRFIHSSSVVLERMGIGLWPRESTAHMQSVVATFHLNDLNVDYDLQGGQSDDRRVVFFLAGPRTFWPTSSLLDYSHTGSIGAECFETDPELDLGFASELEIRPWYFFEKTKAGGRTNQFTDTLAVTVKANVPLESLSDEDLIAHTTKFVDDLTLLASLASCNWIEWYRREFSGGRVHRSYQRTGRRSYVEELERHHLLVDPLEAYSFLRTSLHQINELREQKLDLRDALIYFVGGSESRYLEQQFSTMFLSLEKIKDMYAKKESIRFTFKEREFNEKIGEALKTLIERQVEDEGKRAWVAKKLPELNRPPMREVIDLLLSAYDVTWRDLYPPKSHLTILETRNRLFHSSEQIDIDSLANETQRLKVILARLLLKILGWKRPPRFATGPFLRMVRSS